MSLNLHSNRGKYMQLLEKKTLLKAIDSAIIINKEIEVIDWKSENTYISGTSNYDGIIIRGTSSFEFHYSIFHKIFNHVFHLSSMPAFEKAMWHTLMAICLIKRYTLKVHSSQKSNFCNVLEIESGHYLSLNFKNTIDDTMKFENALCFNEIDHSAYECSNYEDLLNCFLLPILNNETQEFGMSFKSIDDINDDNFLVLTAFSL